MVQVKSVVFHILRQILGLIRIVIESLEQKGVLFDGAIVRHHLTVLHPHHVAYVFNPNLRVWCQCPLQLFDILVLRVEE